MKRRSFIQRSLALAAAPMMLNGIPIRSMASSLSTQAFTCEEIADRVLVLVQLHGGNDGLNTIVPIDQFSTYATLRPNIGLPDTGSRRVINLDATLPLADQVGLHPEMTAIKSLYDQGLVNVIQGVSYPNNNKSHFKAKDDWMTGSDNTLNHDSGWVGRYLDYRYPNFPSGYPNAQLPDPLGLELGSNSISLGFHQDNGTAMGLALSGDPGTFFNLVSGVGGLPPSSLPASHYGTRLRYVMDIEANGNAYAQRINSVYALGTNASSVTYPTVYPGTTNKNELAPQLQTVARLISGGSKTRVYLVRLTGFDTHVAQTDTTDPTIGTHAVLLHHLSEAVKAFQDDLVAQGLEDRVMTATFSEFGRRAAENGSTGTDHGTLAPMIIFGKGVSGGVTGTNVDLSNLNGNNLQGLQNDYRQVFTTLLQDWLGASSTALQHTQFGSFVNQQLQLVNSNYTATATCYQMPFPIGLKYFTATPVKGGNAVQLDWGSSSEYNNKGFTIERSADGEEFDPIAEVEGAGTKHTASAYQLLDHEPITGKSYYRLKQTDFNGTFTYFDTVEVLIEKKLETVVEVYPNPTDASAKIDYRMTGNERPELQVRDNLGRLIHHTLLPISKDLQTHPLDVSEWAPGLYFIRISDEEDAKTVKLVVR